MPLGQRARSSSLGDLLGAHVGHAEREQELLLATDTGLMLPLRGRDLLSVHLFQLFELGLPGCFASRRTLRRELVRCAAYQDLARLRSQSLQCDFRPHVLLRSTPNPTSSVMTPQRGQGLG